MAKSSCRSIVHDNIKELAKIYDIDDSTKLIEDLGLDSIDIVELVVMLEDSFAIELYEADILASVVTVKDLVDFIEEELS